MIIHLQKRFSTAVVLLLAFGEESEVVKKARDGFAVDDLSGVNHLLQLRASIGQ